ncbi:MAG: protein phosphatase 2C domain-containing protein [Synergistaceae bacterium]|nr:protein phosphatase 2C domain-containing protein [Candidatus Equadaptatus faecalis]
MILIKDGQKTEFKPFAVRTIGSSHIAKNRPCEDYALKNDTETYSLIAVCDGHGGDDYVRSEKGSRFAAESAESCVAEFVAEADIEKLRTEKRRKEMFRQLETSIIARWDEKVSADWAENPLTEEEKAIISDKAKVRYENGRFQPAYGTTLITVVFTKEYWFALQIGDGRCVMLDDEDNFSQPVPWDDKCEGTATTSICDSSSINEFRSCFSEKFPKAVFIASDGVEDSFRDEEKMYAFYKAVYSSFADKEKAWETAEGELQDYLPRMSEKGSHDDISVAGILKIQAEENAAVAADTDVAKTTQNEDTETAKEEKNSAGVGGCLRRWIQWK